MVCHNTLLEYDMCETNGEELFAGTCVRVEDMFDQMWESWEQHSSLKLLFIHPASFDPINDGMHTLRYTHSDDVSDFSSPNWALPIEL